MTPVKKSAPPALDPVFRRMLEQAGLPLPVREYRFHPERKFRWDYAWVDALVALEQQGGVWSRGAHGRGTGIVRDMEKISLGATLGWRVLLVQPSDLCQPQTLEWIGQCLGNRVA